MSDEASDNARREHFRFPCEQTEYIKTVGKLLLTILCGIFTELGFEVKPRSLEANGVDMEVLLASRLALVIEVLNWSIGSRLTDNRKDNIIRNLCAFDCNRLLVHTIPLSNLHGLEENEIDIIQLGYQVLPETYYDFFLTKEQVERRRIDCDSTRRDIRAKILEYVNSHFS